MNRKRSLTRFLPNLLTVVPPNITPLLPGSALRENQAHGGGRLPVMIGIFHRPKENT